RKQLALVTPDGPARETDRLAPITIAAPASGRPWPAPAASLDSQALSRKVSPAMAAAAAPTSVKQLKTLTGNVKQATEAALDATGGLLRLAPCWVPRSFLQPGKRLKLDPRDLYAFGLNRGGIDERWFGSTTPAANENRTPDEGLSYVVHNGQRFTL